MNRTNHKQARSLAASVLALSLAFGGSAFAADTAPAASSNTTASASGGLVLKFSDVDSSHWAIKHVTKLASLGIIQGYEKGEYRPENSVSQQEVIVMAIRMMGLEKEALSNTTETVLPVSVDSFFKPYVAFAIDKGLISAAEEQSTTPGKSAWGSREATREWVAKLVIRAIGKEDLAKQHASSTVPFVDAGEFAASNKGYVNAAVLLGIVQGFEDGSFKPAGKVTRAQMATFLSRADKELTTRSARVTTGYVMELSDKKITVLDSKDQTVTYNLSPDTVIYNAKNDTRIPLSAIKLTNEVYVIQNLNNVLYLELTNEEEHMEVTEGTLESVYLDQMMLSLKQGNQDPKLFPIATGVSITDPSGRGLNLSSVPLGSIVELRRNTLLKQKEISQISVKQTPVSKTAEGTVLSIDQTQGQISFMEKTKNQAETYPLAAGAIVTLADGNTADMSKLHAGDIVSYEIKANRLASVTVKKQADVVTTVQGTLTNVLNKDDNIMTITKSGGSSLASYFINSNAIVSINGLSGAGLLDLEKGDELTLDLLNDKVVKVTVTNRQIESLDFATINLYDPSTKGLLISKENGELGAYKLTDTTTIKYLESTIKLDQFQSLFMDSGTTTKKKVNIKASKGRIVSIEMSTTLEGTIASFNTTSNEVTIRTANGQNLVFKAPYGIQVELQNKSNGTLADLQVGDSVKAALPFTQDSITSIAVKKAGVYKVQVTNASTKQVSAKDELDGSLITFTVDSLDKIYNPLKAVSSFDDMVIDEYVTASFVGTKLDKVSILKLTRGKVTAVDAALSTVTVQDYAGGTQVLPLGQNFTIKPEGGSLSAAITTLKPNDRVEVVQTTDGQYRIHVAGTSKRVVDEFDYVLNQFVFKPSGSSKNRYSLYAKAYLQKGGQPAQATSFTSGEEVNLYILDDKIIEIEKP